MGPGTLGSRTERGGEIGIVVVAAVLSAVFLGPYCLFADR